MRITMVGTGYVGLVTGACLSNMGNSVTCLDIDQHKIDLLNNGISPIFEPGLDTLIERNAKANRLHFTTNKTEAYQSAEAIFICVGTPSDDQGNADLSYVLQCARDIGAAIEQSDDATEKIVIVKSTVPVGTNAKVKAAIQQQTSKKFHMASNPEFLKEGAAINDFNIPDRVVLGVENKQTGDRLREIYEPFVRQGNPIFIMDIPSAEMVKYASNAMLATKISFINEIASLCESYNADIDEVRRGMCSDQRIGNRFLYPGLGYGGSCFPKDVLACIGMGIQSEMPTQLLASVHKVNSEQRCRFIKKIDEHFNGNLQGLHFAVWGLAFKPGTDDMREAPSITIIQHLLENGATVTAHDPVAIKTTQKVLADSIKYSESPYETTQNADALIICTEWSDFRNPDFDHLKENLKSPVIFDGRNLYRPQSMEEYGFTYYSVGRPTAGANSNQPDNCTSHA